VLPQSADKKEWHGKGRVPIGAIDFMMILLLYKFVWLYGMVHFRNLQEIVVT
jgi:hypothetical protein